MSTSISASVKKRGRPKTTGTPRTIGVRVHDGDIAALDKWAQTQGNPAPTRSEAIRRAMTAHLMALGFLPLPGDPERTSDGD